MHKTNLEPMARRIDTDGIKRAHNMTTIVEADLGRPARRGSPAQWSCPFHSDYDPSFTVYSDHAYCFGCGWSGDVIKWTMDRQHLSFAEACNMLGATFTPENPSVTLSSGNAQRLEPRAAPVHDDVLLVPEAPSEAWQEAAWKILVDCETNLWREDDPVAANVRTYLYSRGLTKETLQAFYIGYNPIERNIPEVGLRLLPGITIPIWHEKVNTLYGINVRLSKGARAQWREKVGHDAKYLLAKGSKRAPLGIGTLKSKVYAFVLEGEFDTLLTWQTLERMGKADSAGAFTMGSATSRDINRWLLFYPEMTNPSCYLIATDSDSAGMKAAQYWLDATKRSRVWAPPMPCKDITELWQKHGLTGLRVWITEGLRKYG